MPEQTAVVPQSACTSAGHLIGGNNHHIITLRKFENLLPRETKKRKIFILYQSRKSLEPQVKINKRRKFPNDENLQSREKNPYINKYHVYLINSLRTTNGTKKRSKSLQQNTWSIAEEETVILRRVQDVIPRHQRHLGPAFDQAADLVVFQPAIDGHDPHVAVRIKHARFL